MATIMLGSTKQANRLITYCEKKAAVRDGLNCDPKHVREQFRMTRIEWDKNDGIQAHHIIQSFSPEDNITKEEANALGLKLAEQIAKGYEVVVYTHTDREHIHNHIIVNSVSFVDGRKYHSDRKQLYKIREISNELCRERGLSVIREPSAKDRFSLAEYRLNEKGQRLWKDEIRTAIDEAQLNTNSLEEMKSYLNRVYGIEMKIQNKNVSFLHPTKQKFVRGSKLGHAYEKETLEREYGAKRQSQTRTAGRTNGRAVSVNVNVPRGDHGVDEHRKELHERDFRQTRDGIGKTTGKRNGTFRTTTEVEQDRNGLTQVSSRNGTKEQRTPSSRDTELGASNQGSQHLETRTAERIPESVQQRENSSETQTLTGRGDIGNKHSRSNLSKPVSTPVSGLIDSVVSVTKSLEMEAERDRIEAAKRQRDANRRAYEERERDRDR